MYLEKQFKKAFLYTGTLSSSTELYDVFKGTAEHNNDNYDKYRDTIDSTFKKFRLSFMTLYPNKYKKLNEIKCIKPSFSISDTLSRVLSCYGLSCTETDSGLFCDYHTWVGGLGLNLQTKLCVFSHHNANKYLVDKSVTFYFVCLTRLLYGYVNLDTELVLQMMSNNLLGWVVLYEKMRTDLHVALIYCGDKKSEHWDSLYWYKYSPNGASLKQNFTHIKFHQEGEIVEIVKLLCNCA